MSSLHPPYIISINSTILLGCLIGFQSPSGFLKSRNFIELILSLASIKSEPWVHSLDHDLIDLVDDSIPLHPKSLRYVYVIHIFHDLALHHRASIVVFDIALPSALCHESLWVKALLSEKLDCIIVSIGQKVLKIFLLSMVFKSVHQTSAKTFNLLACGNR